MSRRSLVTLGLATLGVLVASVFVARQREWSSKAMTAYPPHVLTDVREGATTTRVHPEVANREEALRSVTAKQPWVVPGIDRVEQVGAFTVQLQLATQPASSEREIRARAVVFTSQLPLGVEVFIGRAARKPLQSVPVAREAWSRALTIRIARTSSPESAVVCEKQVLGVFRGIRFGQRLDDGDTAEWAFREDVGLSVLALLTLIPSHATAGEYVLWAELDEGQLAGAAGPGISQRSRGLTLILKEEQNIEDRVSVLNSQMSEAVTALNYASAVEKALEIIQTRPFSVNAHSTMALVLWKSGDAAQAVAVMERSLLYLEKGLDPDPAFRDGPARDHVASGLRQWIKLRRGELEGRPAKDKDE